jgi:hypothetical protein
VQDLDLKLMKMTRIVPVATALVVAAFMTATMAQTPQPTYQPKFKGDPARSDSEAAALGYLRTFLRAQKVYKKKNDRFATSLMELSKTGSFTRRMASSTNRGDYTVKFIPHKDKDWFEIEMVPKQLDSTHRSFFAKMEGNDRRDDGAIRADEQKEADEHSPILKPD